MAYLTSRTKRGSRYCLNRFPLKLFSVTYFSVNYKFVRERDLIFPGVSSVVSLSAGIYKLFNQMNVPITVKYVYIFITVDNRCDS